jgi:hypothetical protein
VSSSSPNSGRDAYIAGLRDLADWLEQHPDADFPRYSTGIAVPLRDNGKVEDFAAATGVEVVFDKDGNASADVKFGPLVYHVYGYADWTSWTKAHDEKRARTWADKHGMAIEPRKGGDES